MKKILSLVLCFTMVFTTIPTLVFAENSTKPQKNTMIKSDDLSVSGKGSIGKLLSNEISDKLAEQESINGNNIISVEVEDDVATVEYQAVKDCTLVVAIYSEDEIKMLASGSQEVLAEEDTAEVTIDIDTMPEYFCLKAFLVETDDYSPLCSAFSSSEYTKDMQELLNSDINDYDSNRVLNLDDDDENNFVVFNENVKQIEEKSNKNKISIIGETKYKITNADESFTTLKRGDIFSYKYNNEVIVVKIKTITVSGTTVTIESQNSEMEEVFDKVKINTEAGMNETTVDNSTCDEGVEFENGNTKKYLASGEGSIGTSTKYSISKNIGSDDKYIKLSGSVSFDITAKIEFYVAFLRKYVKLSLEYESEIEVEITGEAEFKLELGEITIMPILGVFVKFVPSFVGDVTAEVSLTGTLSGSIGIKAEGGSISNISKKPTFDAELKGEITVFLGFSLEPKVVFISEWIAKASLTVTLGAEIKGTMSKSTATDERGTHLCGSSCIQGEINGKLKLSGSVQFLKLNSLKWEKDFFEIIVKIADFYYSLKFGDFGWTKCPHYVNENGNNSGNNNGNNGYESENGEATLESDFYYYELSDGTIEIRGYKGKGGNIIIPNKIAEKSVTSIYMGAFSDCT